MLINKGFTLIETLFVLLIICILSTISMTVVIPQQSDESTMTEISQFFYQAQLHSIVHKETTNVDISSHKINIHSYNLSKEYHLPQNTSLQNHQFSFNSLGHISKAKTITFHGKKQDYHFVFQIGSGSFYVE